MNTFNIRQSVHTKATITLTGLLLIALVLLPSISKADSKYVFLPSVSVLEVWDDNLFFTVEDEQSTRISRVTPTLELGLESQRLNWRASYRFDAEKYHDHSELDSNQVRQIAYVGADYQPNSKLKVSLVGDYIQTQTPVDIGLTPGGVTRSGFIGRVEAQRATIKPELQYHFNSTTESTISFTRTEDKVEDGVKSTTELLEAEWSKKLSKINTFQAGYNFRGFNSGESGAGESEESHTPWLGWQRIMSRYSSVYIRVGPRFGEDSNEGYVHLGMRRVTDDSRFELEYQRNEATLLGDLDSLEFESYSALFSKQFGREFNFTMRPAYTKLSQRGATSDILTLGLEAAYRVARSVFLTASVDMNYQELDFEQEVDKVDRNVVQIGISFVYPRREETEEENN